MRISRRFLPALSLLAVAGCGLGFGSIGVVPADELPGDAATSATTPPTFTTEPPDATLEDGAVEPDAAPPPPSCNDGVQGADETDVDCGGPLYAGCAIGRKCGVSRDCAKIAVCGEAKQCVLPLSCKELLAAHPGLPDDVYRLATKARTGDYEAACDMRTSGGGFTLLMKVDGTKSTFAYDANVWTTTTLLAANSPRADRTEAKLASYHEVALGEIVLVFETDAATRRLTLPAQGVESLAALVARGRTTTNLGRNAWLGLVGGSALQGNCNAEGISVEEGQRKLRIGIMGNEFGGCTAPDSYVGIGSNEFCGKGTRAGNVACFNSGNGGDRDKASFAWVYAR